MSGLAERSGEEVAWDDVTGAGLDPKEVRAARGVLRQDPRVRLGALVGVEKERRKVDRGQVGGREQGRRHRQELSFPVGGSRAHRGKI